MKYSFNDATPTDNAREILEESKDKLLKISLIVIALVFFARYYLS